MREPEPQRTSGLADRPAPASPAPADTLRTAGEAAKDSGRLAAGVAKTFRKETRLNTELVKVVALAHIAELIGFALTWAVLLAFVGYATYVVTDNGFIAFAVAGGLQLVAMAAIMRGRRGYQKKMGYPRTRALMTGSDARSER